MESLKSGLKGALEEEVARIPKPFRQGSVVPDNQVFSLWCDQGGGALAGAELQAATPE